MREREKDESYWDAGCETHKESKLFLLKRKESPLDTFKFEASLGYLKIALQRNNNKKSKNHANN